MLASVYWAEEKKKKYFQCAAFTTKALSELNRGSAFFSVRIYLPQFMNVAISPVKPK